MEPITVFKIASSTDEFEQIHCLNYKTFAEEIPQHSLDGSGRLVDKFHAENTYLVGLREGRVIAMLAVRRRRPFSLDLKVPDLDLHLPLNRKVVELRLLAVLPAYRNGPVPVQLLHFTARTCLDLGDDLAVISGAQRRKPLYRALGFEDFGPVVGTAEAPFQPMMLTLENFARASGLRRGLQGAAGPASAPREPLNLLPGPVAVSPAVREALARPPVSHRSPEFLGQLSALRRRLAALAQAADVQVMPGSGSLANDVVAAQLAASGQPGVVLSSGEFGERLADHARRAGMDFHWARLPWGAVISVEEIKDALAQVAAPGWLWLSHHETSTGVLHDIAPLKALARGRGLRLCLDCISTLGAIPVDLTGVHLATGTSGKALGGLPGLALVFHQEEPVARPDLPRYLDLALWSSSGGAPFTHSSNLVAALDMALAEVERLPAGRCGDAKPAAWLRRELQAAGFTLCAPDSHASSIIVTVQLPPAVRSMEVGAALEQRGFLTSYRSGYLVARNWIQFCLMSQPPQPALAKLLVNLCELSGLTAYREAATG